MRIWLTGLALGACALLSGCNAPETTDGENAAVEGLLDRVNIAYETFTLDNGLRVIVHEDRKAPVVAVSVWYNVGSKDEPAGQTGFAHLFEHLMRMRLATISSRCARSGPPITTAPPGSTAPIIFRPCRARRLNGGCSSKATAWDTCSAR